MDDDFTAIKRAVLREKMRRILRDHGDQVAPAMRAGMEAWLRNAADHTVIDWSVEDTITMPQPDGEIRTYGGPENDNEWRRELQAAIDRIRGEQR